MGVLIWVEVLLGLGREMGLRGYKGEINGVEEMQHEREDRSPCKPLEHTCLRSARARGVVGYSIGVSITRTHVCYSVGPADLGVARAHTLGICCRGCAQLALAWRNAFAMEGL